jgi:hypothetical protein
MLNQGTNNEDMFDVFFKLGTSRPGFFNPEKALLITVC